MGAGQWIAEAETPNEKRHREASDFLKYENSVGEFFDFHACRHGYITLISETCKSLKQAQTLARVSTPKLLDRYSHIQLHGMQQAADAIGQMLANGGTRQPGRRREAAAAPLATTGTDDEKPAPAGRSIRGASRGSSPASGGRTWHAVAGWEACDAPDSEQSEQPASDPKTKKPLRRPLLSAHRRGFRSRGSGRSRTDDGGFAIRCLSHLATEPYVETLRTLRKTGRSGQARCIGLTLPLVSIVAFSTVMRMDRPPAALRFNLFWAPGEPAMSESRPKKLPPLAAATGDRYSLPTSAHFAGGFLAEPFPG